MAKVSVGSGTNRPGLMHRPAVVEFREAFDLDRTRIRLIESGVYEIGRALGATADELFAGLCQAADRLEQPDEDELQACPQCGRLGEWTTEGPTGIGAKFCNKSCRRLWGSVRR